MFHRSNHLRAVKAAGGGHQVAADASLRLPWAGIFEPWRPFVLAAAAAENADRTKNVPVRCRKRSARLEAAGQLRLPDYGLLPDFPSPAAVEVPLDDRPLFDLFPEAYL